MNHKKKIALITVDYIVNHALLNQLKEVFKDGVEVVPMLLPELDTIDVTGYDLIVSSSKIIEKEIKDKINCVVPIISIKRTMKLNKLTEVISLDIGEKVLLVSNHKDSANEVILVLEELGIDHVEYVPYYPGCTKKIEHIDVAVTPGGKYLVPKEIKKIIDIGLRIIDISTILEIFIKLNLPNENLNILLAKNAKEMVRLNKHNSESNKILRAMFDVISDGIASLDVSGNIFFCNNKFASYLGYKNTELISKNIVEVIDDEKIVKIILDLHQSNNELIDIKDKEFVLNKTLLYQGDILKGYVLGIEEVTRIRSLETKVRKKLISKGFVARYNFKDLIGVSSELMRKVSISKKIAKSDMTVLILGEDGTGKEIFANAIHNASKRKNEPFVAVNFAALSENLVESELFGYEEGAFTGAVKGGKAGFFEQAYKGTIFIDEVGDISPKIQSRLLRVLQEKHIMRVGGTSIIPIDVRVIAATNKNLLELVSEGKFRKDLYYRLKVLHLNVPSLAQRKEDIPLLVQYFFEKLGSDKYLSKEVLSVFNDYSWPGNVRELENIVYYLENIVDDKEVKVEDLPDDFVCQGDYTTNIHELNDSVFDMIPMGKKVQYIEILKIIKDASKINIRLGRNRISEMLKSRGIKLSVDQVRIKLKELEKLSLVKIGSTKQGTTISERGEKFLNEFY